MMRHGSWTHIWEKNGPGGRKSKPRNPEADADSGCTNTKILTLTTQHLPEVLFRLHNGFTGYQPLF